MKKVFIFALLFGLFVSMTNASDYIAEYEAISQSVGAVRSHIGSMRNVKARVGGEASTWAKVYGGFGEDGTDDKITGSSFSNIGGMVGLDYSFTNCFTVGGFIGYTHTDQELYHKMGEMDSNTVRLGTYATYSWDKLFLSLTPSFGIRGMNVDNRKTITADGFVTNTSGERTGFDFNINGTVGYDFELPLGFTITPSYSLGYTMLYDPEYKETGNIYRNGANAALRADIKSFVSNSLLQDIELKVAKTIQVNECFSLMFSGWGGYELEFVNTGGSRSSSLTAANTVYRGIEVDGMPTNRGFWGLGVDAMIKDNVNVFGRYDHKVWGSGYSVGFTAGVNISF